MIARETLIAGVLAATDKMVQHANMGDWQAARKTSADRRVLLDQLASQDPQANEHGFVRAMREAAAESDAALKLMSKPSSQELSSAAAVNSNSSVNSGSDVNSSAPLAAGRICTKA